MPQRIIIILLILFGVYLESSGKITIFCEYTNDSYHRSLYTCVASPSVSCGDNCTDVVYIEGKHSNGRTNKDVQAFVMENKNVTKLPKNLATWFPNLLFLNFRNNLISNITKADLEPHSKLESIRLTNNQIIGIFEDIFESLPIIHIEIDNNELEYVIHNLTYPKSVVLMNFKNNKCVDMDATSQDAIDKLKDKLLLRCSHSPRTKELEENVENIRQHDLESDHKIKRLENIIERLKNAIKIKL